MGKYGGSGEHSFGQSHCSANFVWEFLPVGSKITEMTHRERNSRIMERGGRKNIEVVRMSVEKYDGGVENDGLKKGVIIPYCQTILLGTTLEHLSQLRI